MTLFGGLTAMDFKPIFDSAGKMCAEACFSQFLAGYRSGRDVAKRGIAEALLLISQLKEYQTPETVQSFLEMNKNIGTAIGALTSLLSKRELFEIPKTEMSNLLKFIRTLLPTNLIQEVQSLGLASDTEKRVFFNKLILDKLVWASLKALKGVNTKNFSTVGLANYKLLENAIEKISA